MIVAYENATGLVMRGEPGELAPGEIVIVARNQPRQVVEVIERVAVVEVHPAGPGMFGVAAGDGFRLAEYRGGQDYLLRWVPDPPDEHRKDSRRFELGGVTYYTTTGGVEG